MKYFFWLFIVLLTFGGCKQGEKRYYIGFSQCNSEEWQHQVSAEAQREMRFLDNVKLEIRTIKNDNNLEQIKDIRRFIALKVDLLVVSPNESAALTPVINEAYELGIPVILVDRKITSNSYTAFIGADNQKIGELAGEYLQSIRNNSVMNVYEFIGTAGASTAQERHEGFINAIKSKPNIRYIGYTAAHWHKEMAQQKADSILRKYPEINVVFAQNDHMALGVYQAAKRLNKEKQIKIIGTDALPGDSMGIDLVKKGVLTATIINPTGGDKLIQTAMAILQHRPYKRNLIQSTAVIDQSNALIASAQAESIQSLDNKIRTLSHLLDKNLNKYNTQQLLLSLLGVIVFLLVVIAFITARAYWLKNRNNELLQKRNEEISLQRDQTLRLSKQIEEATNNQLDYYTNVSHDLRTPLTLIADPLNLILHEGAFTPNQKHYFPIIQKNVNVLLELVNQVLDFRKYENRMHTLSLYHFELIAQLKRWISSFEGTADAHRIKLHLDTHGHTDIPVTLDLHKLECILYNLLSNALKHTPTGGQITLSVHTFKEQASSFIKLKVADTGSGIAPEHIKKIFNRMYQIDNTNGGSGIGLAIVKAYVELHHGRISVDSNVGKGSVFTLIMPTEVEGQIQAQEMELPPQHLPNNEDEEANTHSIYTDATIQEASKLILVVDDNSDICDLISRNLQNEFQVICAPNGKEGLTKALKYIPDLIISDIMMPVMDGIELTTQIKKKTQTCHIPVILLTARNQDEQRVKSFNGGADAYIIKPFSSEVLVARVHNLLENRRILKDLFSDKTAAKNIVLQNADKLFITTFQELLQKQMGDSDLTVDQLAAEMQLSRIQLYRKVKALTNTTPIELLKTTRMNKAHELRQTTQKSTQEIAAEVGFTSSAYFSKCYKETFGENPNPNK